MPTQQGIHRVRLTLLTASVLQYVSILNGSKYISDYMSAKTSRIESVADARIVANHQCDRR